MSTIDDLFSALLSALDDYLETSAELQARKEGDDYPSDRWPDYTAEACGRAVQELQIALDTYIDARIAAYLNRPTA